MLINDFFEIQDLKSEGNVITSRIRLNPGHKIFAAHFPGNPITPGVVQMQIVKEILQHVHKKELRLLAMPRCNFLKILNPITTPEVTIAISFSENPLQISASGTEGPDTFFKLSALYSDESSAN